MEVGIRELRLNLSRYVARVRAGAEVIVTDRGEPVAKLGPVDDGETKRARLIREGKLTPARAPKRTTLPPPVPLVGEGPLVSEMVLEDRR
ncbi:MAG: type II toxin-antitoxin system prevent-host-death family antitoxin [Gaiellaceae bacterium]